MKACEYGIYCKNNLHFFTFISSKTFSTAWNSMEDKVTGVEEAVNGVQEAISQMANHENSTSRCSRLVKKNAKIAYFIIETFLFIIKIFPLITNHFYYKISV
jgi:hypothetical protein